MENLVTKAKMSDLYSESSKTLLLFDTVFYHDRIRAHY